MQFLRLLLLPLSLIYGCITAVRNWLFDRGIKKTYVIPNKSICIGNITVGGTGKSPMTIYITELLNGFQPAILSRGYGRSTKGPMLATGTDNASTIGDEPFMYLRRFGKSVPIVVAEERKAGVALLNRNGLPTIILDDAFQHRQVKAGFQLVLMTYDRPIFRDFPFPAGNLRESRGGLKRADAVVITKTPAAVDENAKKAFLKRLNFPAENIFFSSIEYGAIVPLYDAIWEAPEKVLLVTGIADPRPLETYLRRQYDVELMAFPDHHAFSAKDIQAIHQKVATFASHRYAIVTTEKDAVRLLSLKDNSLIQKAPWFYQGMQVRIDREDDFNDLLLKYVTGTNERSR
jgi:tetraacyldisaccharide 4'-kinase